MDIFNKSGRKIGRCSHGSIQIEKRYYSKMRAELSEKYGTRHFVFIPNQVSKNTKVFNHRLPVGNIPNYGHLAGSNIRVAK